MAKKGSHSSRKVWASTDDAPDKVSTSTAQCSVQPQGPPPRNFIEKFIGRPGGQMANSGPRTYGQRIFLWTAGILLLIVFLLSSVNVGMFLSTPILAIQSSGHSNLEGRVGSVDGLALDNSTIFLPDHNLSALTDTSGWFRIDNVPSGLTTMRIYHEGYRTKEFKVILASSGTTDINEMLDVGTWLTLTPMIADERPQFEKGVSSLSGRLTCGNETTSGSAVLSIIPMLMDRNGTLGPSSAPIRNGTTDTNGSYCLQNLTSSWYWLLASWEMNVPGPNGITEYILSVTLFIPTGNTVLDHSADRSLWKYPNGSIRRAGNIITETLDLMTQTTLTIHAGLEDPASDWVSDGTGHATQEPPMYTVSAYISDPILLREPGQGAVLMCRTSSPNTSLSLELPRGIYNITVSREGMRLVSLGDVQLDTDRSMNVSLREGVDEKGHHGKEIVDAVNYPILITWGIVLSLISLATLVGGILCFARRRYAIALVASIVGMFAMFPINLAFCNMGTILCLIAFILIFKSRLDFRS